jgi:HK97 family phage major capsid protein
VRKFWNFIESGESRELRLEGIIAEETWWGDEVTPAAFREDLQSATGDITVWINSHGGDVFAATQIYNMLKEYSAKSGKVTVKIDAIAASSASIIAMAGDVILMSPLAHMFIHNPSTIAIGDSAEMLKAKALLDSVKESIINAYEMQTGLPREKLSMLMDAETDMTAQVAVSMGFADGIMYQDGETHAVTIPTHILNTTRICQQKVFNSLLMKICDKQTKTERIQLMEDRILKLRDECSRVTEEALAFIENNKVGEDWSDSDNETYAKMEKQITTLNNEIGRLERAKKLKEGLTAPANPAVKAILNNPNNSIKSTERESGFWNYVRGISVSNDLALVPDSKGGYLAPDEFHRELVLALEEHNVMRKICRIISTSSGELQIPVVATQGTASWLGEAEEISTSDTNFGQVTLNAHKLGTMIKVSQELLDDSEFPLDSFMADDFGRRLGILEEEAFISGDGVNKPTGFMTTAPSVDAANATITFDDVMTLFHELKPPYRNKAVFLCNDTTVKTLRQLKDNTGQYLWQESLAAGTPSTVLGHPVHVSRFMPDISASAKVLAFGDFSYYWIADRKGRTFKRLDELFQTTDQIGFKATQRVDGKLILPEAIKVLKMGTT